MSTKPANLAYLVSRKTVKKRRNVSEKQSPPGASTPYKRWRKCAMKKIGGEVFAGT